MKQELGLTAHTYYIVYVYNSTKQKNHNISI